MLFKIFSVLAFVVAYVAAETHTVSFVNKSVLSIVASTNPGEARLTSTAVHEGADGALPP